MEQLWAGDQEWCKKILPNDSCITALFGYKLVTTRRMTAQAASTIPPTEQALSQGPIAQEPFWPPRPKTGWVTQRWVSLPSFRGIRSNYKFVVRHFRWLWHILSFFFFGPSGPLIF